MSLKGFKEQVGAMLRAVIPFIDEPGQTTPASKSLDEAADRLNKETRSIKEDVGHRNNAEVLLQMLEKLK